MEKQATGSVKLPSHRPLRSRGTRGARGPNSFSRSLNELRL